MDNNRSIIKQIPNWLTFIRILLIPVFVFFMANPLGMDLRVATNWALVVFVVAAVTDYIDGIIARRVGAVSSLGKLIDPLADKILVMSALVMLVSRRSELSGDPWIPGWLVVIALAREFWVTGLRAVAAGKAEIISASSAGKIKSALQMIAILFLLLHDYRVPLGSKEIPCYVIGINVFIVSLAYSLWGAGEYTLMVFGRKDSAGEDMRESAANN
ncbi:MAG: CDP-diacylglycerol--glycerol-3-phosphate 3-phosphatidyltransferase [Candidatus Dadabacteria bacterium]|nr:MAG: CDP-diacylglycerol--glycerol-3-phosphate 3-phosphatidyltransferase [Candidatus Dadabacteria bacterium]